MKPQYSQFQIWYSDNIFVNNSSNYNPRIRKLLFLYSAKAGLLKNVQNHILRCYRGWEISKTKVGTFFLNTLYVNQCISKYIPWSERNIFCYIIIFILASTNFFSPIWDLKMLPSCETHYIHGHRRHSSLFHSEHLWFLLCYYAVVTGCISILKGVPLCCILYGQSLQS